MSRLMNFINGQMLEPKSGQFMDKMDPTTGEVMYQLPDSDEVDAVLAIQAANKAFVEWSQTPADARAKILYRIADLIDANLDRLALAESRDVGKPLQLAKTLDIPRAAWNFRFFAGRILHRQEMCTDMDGEALNYVLRQPVGVAGLIAPWNLPLYLLTWKLAPALACGNTAVCKPSEFTSATSMILCELLNEAGLPPGVCNLVMGRGDRAGAAIVKHPGVPLISFTGGTVTGEKVQQMAAPQFKKLSLELGGKNANIILNDADLKKAVPMSIRSSFLNQGEICLCGSKILVQEEVYAKFIDEFCAQVEKLRVGDPQDPETFMGPLVSKGHFDKVMSCIEAAKKDGGKILTGGSAPSDLPSDKKKGYWLRPTVISDLSNCSELHQTEIFGPVVTVMSVKYPHDAIKWANNSSYGLSASLWTKDVSKAHKLAAQLRAGTVWVNTWLKRDLRVPFGGIGSSGLGREGGDYSLDFFTHTKTVCVQF